MSSFLRKLAKRLADAEKAHYREGDLGPGVPERRISLLPKIKAPQVWEFSAHPHLADKAGPHIDIRLGNPETGIAHSFVLPRKTELPKPGESAKVIPTYDHTIPYMDYTGPISTEYGKGHVKPGRRTLADVYHAEPEETPGTKLRFNLYDSTHPEEFVIHSPKSGLWMLRNKTQTRERRPDLPDFKPKYKEVDVKDVDIGHPEQVMMPKLDGAHSVIDLQAGRSPRVFSYRVGKVAKTGLLEHTHKLQDLLKDKVPDELDGTVLRGETIGIDRKGKAVPAETIGGLLNSKVWESRAKQRDLGVSLHAFPFDVVKYKGKSMEGVPFSDKLHVLKEVEEKIKDLWIPEIALSPVDKAQLLKKIEKGKHPLTREGVVLVTPSSSGPPTKAKFAPDFDVFVRDVHPAVSGKTGEPHDRAGSVSYSWTESGKVVGRVGGFPHALGKDMLQNPDKYIGRVARVKAMRLFADGSDKGALFQPRFAGWHLDKGDIEKQAMWSAFVDELTKIAELNKDQVKVKVTEDPAKFVSKLKPGDILMTRSDKRFLSKVISSVQKARGVESPLANWSHVGVYVGDGKVRHAHLPIMGHGLGVGSKVRDHAIDAVYRTGVDFLALRPDVPKSEREEAVARSEDLLGRSYDSSMALRASLFPVEEWKSKELKKKNLPEGVICTSVAGYSYPKIQFGPTMRSIHSLMPSDVVASSKLKPIVALSYPKE
jgi:hypothetical protein